jgi:hypothetical protein
MAVPGQERGVASAGVAILKECKAQETSALDDLLRRAVLCVVATVSLVASADAQDAEPRAYTNTPVGLDPSLSIADAKFHQHTGAVASGFSM